LSSIARKHNKTLAELAIAWVLRRPEVTAAIVGSRRPSQIQATMAAASWRIPAEDLETIEQLSSGHAQALRASAVAT
jgi:aryl-alcohol dehydrogenase-like predicted oxidoreductase